MLCSCRETPAPMNYRNFRRIFRQQERGGNKEDEEESAAAAAMADPKQQKQPKLDRRNAHKNIDYDAFASSSYSSSSVPLSVDTSSALRTRSLDIIPFDTSFRIEGIEGVDLLYQTLGISGPEDFAISAADWEKSKVRSSSDVFPRSRLHQIESLINPEKEAVKVESKARVRVEDEPQLSVEEFAPPSNESENVISAAGSSGGGIKGVRPPVLAPPPLKGRYVDDMRSASTWDIIGSFAPEEERVSSSCPVKRLDSSSSSSDEEDVEKGEGEQVNGGVVRRAEVEEEEEEDEEEEEEEKRERGGEKTTVMSESPSFSTSNDEDSSSSTTETTYTISPNGSFSRNITSWQRGHVLGSGSFGTVYEAFTDDGFFFAVKEVSLLDQAPQSIYQLEQEIALLREFEHENIVQYLGTDRHEGKLYIFLELVTQGSLVKVYQKYHLGDSQVSAYTRQILGGLEYLHDRNVMHRDIKCANILVHTSGSVKLADFGLAKATKLNDVKSTKGTAFWMAPEVVKRKTQGYGLPADIWSLGCTVLEMLTRQIPYSPLEWMQALFKIGKGTPPPLPDSLSRDARDFILKCLQVNPDNRPTAAQLLNHPFVHRSLPASSVPGSPFPHNSRRS